jgi:CRISPR-associated endonuclease Cas2
MFDVPNKYGKTRDVFRLRLEQLGLKKLQKSVYVSPYSCFQEVEFLRELYGIAITVQYLLVEQIEDDAFLKRQFNL